MQDVIPLNFCSLQLSLTFILHLLDPPKVSIKLGKSLVASDIREGVDVYFDCRISANPLPKSKLVTWLHNVSIILVNELERRKAFLYIVSACRVL